MSYIRRPIYVYQNGEKFVCFACVGGKDVTVSRSEMSDHVFNEHLSKRQGQGGKPISWWSWKIGAERRIVKAILMLDYPREELLTLCALSWDRILKNHPELVERDAECFGDLRLAVEQWRTLQKTDIYAVDDR